MVAKSSYEPGTPSWVDLGSPDPTVSASFYGALFGWDVVAGPPEAGGYRMALLRGAAVAGISPQFAPGPAAWTTYVSVADADAAGSGVPRSVHDGVPGSYDVLATMDDLPGQRRTGGGDACRWARHDRDVTFGPCG